MQIDWWTLALQTVNFLVLVWLLQRFLYAPVREVIDKRKVLAQAALNEASQQQQQAESARLQFDKERQALAQQRQRLAREMQAELSSERFEATQQAQRKADELLNSARATIAQERENTLREIKTEITGLAIELASRLLQDSPASPSIDSFSDRLDDYLQAVPPYERERLQQDLRDDDAHLTVVTALALTPAEQARWVTQLGERLGQNGEILFTVDQQILGGAELRFPHCTIKLTWANQLRDTMERLQREDAL